MTDTNAFREGVCAMVRDVLHVDAATSEVIEQGVTRWAFMYAKNRKVMCKWRDAVFVRVYADRLRTILTNLARNPDMTRRVASMTAEQFSEVSLMELAPPERRALMREKAVRDRGKFDQIVLPTTNEYNCPACTSDKCTYYELQTRSADEPMTVFFECLDCGKRWTG